jgi:hypothetical protein
MDNTIVPVDNLDTLVEADQSNDLLGYLRNQPVQAAASEDGVNVDGAAPQEQSAEEGGENADQAAASQEEPQQQTTAAAAPDDAEKRRYEQAIADLSQQRDVDRTNMLIIAQQARAADDRAFEASIIQMDEDQQKTARAERRAESLQRENDAIRANQQERQNRDMEASKGVAAYKLVTALQLGMDDVEILKTAETPQGMIAMARGLAARSGTQQQSQQQTKQQTRPAVNAKALVAGGDNATAAPPKRVEQRKGDLQGLMRERGYVAVEVG